MIFFTSKAYLRAFPGDTLRSLSSSLDEMIQHAPYLKGHGVDVLIEILNTIAKLGFGAELSSLLQKFVRPFVPVPMEIDLKQKIIS